MAENMAEEETTREPEAPEKPPKPRKKPLLLLGIFSVLFVLAGAGNYIHLKMTYVPPEPLPVEEREEDSGPILTIDLSEDEAEQHEEKLAEAKPDTLGPMIADSVAREDSIQTLIDELHASLYAEDSLLSATRRELDRVKKALKVQDTEEDSANLKRSVKLAKIVENMPPEEAAKMLEPLSDAMVIDILMRLKQRQAAKIMASFSASRSARLSEAILKPLVKR